MPYSHTEHSHNNDVASRISRVENNLVLAEFDGVPRPVWETTHTLCERMQLFGVPGVSIAVINDCEIEWARGYGLLRAQGDVPVTPRTVFEAASTSKMVSAAIALSFVEQGALLLDEDVNQKLVSWKVPENDYINQTKVTLRRLLAHQAGLNRPEGGFGIEGPGVPTTAQVLRGELPATNAPAAIEYVPGSECRYSNFGFVVIQQLLEDVSGRPFAQIAHDTVLEPLEIASSSFEQPLLTDQGLLAAVPHNAAGEPEESSPHPTALGQGGLWTTPSDLARFGVELMRAYGGSADAPGKLISQRMVRRMFTPEVQFGAGEFFGFSGHGLGTFLISGKDEGDWYFVYPGFNEPGATCLLIGHPETGKGAVVMTNGANGQLLQLEILYGIAAVYGWSIHSAGTWT